MDKNRYLIVSAIIVAVSLLVIDITIGIAGDYTMTIIPDFSGQLSKDNYRLNRVKTDVIIVGSSRGCHHYVSTMLKDSINQYTGKQYSLYNGAIRGKFINSNSCSVESIMDRYHPKLIVFDVSEFELDGANSRHDMEFSAPHYKSNRYVRRYLDDLGWKEKVKLRSNMYRYNTKLLRIVSSFISKGEETGYDPLYGTMKVLPVKNTSSLPQKEFDEYTIKNFTRVLETAQNKGILLVIASSPYYHPHDNNEHLAGICKRFNTPYIDMYNMDTFNNHPEYFQDEGHLNDKGAHLFTGLFFANLKPYITGMTR